MEGVFRYLHCVRGNESGVAAGERLLSSSRAAPQLGQIVGVLPLRASTDFDDWRRLPPRTTLNARKRREAVRAAQERIEQVLSVEVNKWRKM